jgi:hypothetical protein
MESSGSDDEPDTDHLSPKRPGPMLERRLSGKTSPGTVKMVGLPGQASPLGMMAALSMGRQKAKRPASIISDVSDLGVANEDFFRARRCRTYERHEPLTDPTIAMDIDSGRLGPPGHRIPPLLRKNIITSVEAEKLFKMYSFFGYSLSSSSDPDLLVRYFDWINISVSLLDPKLYTAQQVYWRCPFLFTVSQ